MDRNEELTQQIGELIVDYAERIFSDCGSKDDFCIQTVGICAVFGGLNRLLFHPSYGFRPDTSYCSKNFIDTFNSLYGG